MDFPFHGGDRPLPAGGLCNEAISAFHSIFPSAAILIDDIAGERMQEAFDELLGDSDNDTREGAVGFAG